MTTQGGEREGTVDRRRRQVTVTPIQQIAGLESQNDPRMRVQDVAITEAAGLTQGPDGYAHPLETNAAGEVKSSDRSATAVLEDILSELRYIREGMVLMGIISDVTE